MNAKRAKQQNATDKKIARNESNYEIGMKNIEAAEDVYFAVGLLENKLGEVFKTILSKTSNFSVTSAEFVCNEPAKLDKDELTFLSRNRKAVLCQTQLNAVLQQGFYNSADSVRNFNDKFMNAYSFAIKRTRKKDSQTFEEFFDEEQLNSLFRAVRLEFNACFGEG